MSLIKELQRRNVFRVAAAYVVVAWLLIQVGATLEPAMHLPDWTDSILAFFLLLGFPVAVFMAWAYELTPDGLKRDGEVDPDESTRLLAGRKWDRMIIVVLVLALGYFALDKYVLQNGSEPLSTGAPEQMAGAGTEAGDPTVANVAEAEADPTMPAISEKSIAVLPFVNMSSDPEQEYFSDGLTEELLNLLAGIDDLKVAARTSSFFYKDKVKEIPFIEIGRQLGVAYLLEGSVRRGGDKIRITAQLIKAEDGFHLWSETYDRTLNDVFAIQDEISAAVVEQLKITLLGEAPHAKVIDTESWELTLQGRFLFNRRSPGDLEKALELFGRAVEIDPDNATAWVGMVPLYQWLFDPPRLEDSSVAVDRALELEPSHPEALARKSYLLYWEGKKAEAWATWNAALEAGPDNILVLGMLAGSRQGRGKFDEAIEIQRRLVTLDPLHGVNVNNLSGYLLEAGRFDEAEHWALRARELSPFKEGDHMLSTIHLFKGDLQAARSELPPIGDGDFNPATDYIPGESLILRAMINHSAGDSAEAENFLAKYREEFAGQSPIGMAYIHAWRGENEKAWEWLERTIEQYPDSNFYQRVLHPFLYTLRDDPRWADVVAHFEKLIEEIDSY